MNSRRILIGGAFLVLALAVGLFGVQFTLFALSPLKNIPAEGVIVEVTKGVSPKELTRNLISQHVLESEEARQFDWLGRMTRRWNKVKAGEYKFTPDMTPMQVFTVLASGISIVHPVTIREGANIYEVAAEVESKGLGKKEAFLKLCHDSKLIQALWATTAPSEPKPKSLEGYLFPDTYHFNKSMTMEDMIRQMVRHFVQVWSAEYDAKARQLGLSRQEVVTLASMIEKETGAPLERPMISSVFHNRLKKRMKLQSDPTTIYGMWDRYVANGYNIHKADLSDPSPYNTYYIPALPAGPIANPGKEALQAALFPSQSEFLFFVSHNDGTHEFTRSYEDHLGAVRKFQLDPKAREGKSWRDLNKNR